MGQTIISCSTCDHWNDSQGDKACISCAPGASNWQHSVHPEKTALEKQEGGSHYKDKGIQPIVYIYANNMGFCDGNVVKYVTRYKEKNGIEDLKKAKHYIELLIEMEYGNVSNS